MKTLVDTNPMASRKEFGDDYGMYCSWCAQVTVVNKNTGERRVLAPVSMEEYFNIELGE